MLLTRWLKHAHYMNNDVKKYLGYAAGEIMLVIAGILIALQIDAWHEERQIANALDGQLHAVAESISQDLATTGRLKRQRIDAIFLSNRMADITGPFETYDEWYDRDYVEFTSNLIAISQIPTYLVSSTGAYRTIESSGYANHIGDSNLKRNLHDYYATVERIEFIERQMNNYIQEVTLKFRTETSQGVTKILLQEPLLAWQEQTILDFPKETRLFRKDYLELLFDSVTQALMRSGRNQPLLKEYEHLLSLGDVVLTQINAYVDQRPYAQAAGDVFHADSLIGTPKVFEQGRFEAHALGFFTAPDGNALGNNADELRIDGDQLTIDYAGGQVWTFVYTMVGVIDVSVQKRSLDYSRFDRIRLELKRHSGCEDLRLVLKDAQDADDGTETNVGLELSDQWKTYDYALSLFSDADLSQLSVVSGFLMGQNACSFSIRDVAFLKPGEA